MTTRGATVEFRNVTKRYGRGAAAHGAVDDLSLRIEAGEICVLVGPSGCGKTTTLKMVNRLVEPTSGRILIGERDVMSEDATRLRRRIGYVIQQVGLFPHQTIAQNIATVPHLVGWDRERIGARVDELLRLVGLDPSRYGGRYPAALSGGERQRVGVARALAAEPPVMLMDEPFGAVDPVVRERLQDEFLELHRSLGMTVLFVTHDIDEAIKIGSRIAVMRAGQVVQYATPEALLSEPVDDFVARFVGADRGLKRLMLKSVADVALYDFPSARVGDRPTAARGGYVLLLDEARRPLGWVNVDRRKADAPLDASEAVPSSPIFSRTTRLRDALSMLLASDTRHGLVVDDLGVYLGTFSIDAVGDVLAEH